jgi:hypothetical protein
MDLNEPWITALELFNPKFGSWKNEDGDHYPVAGAGRPVFSSLGWINLSKIRSKMRSQR